MERDPASDVLRCSITARISDKACTKIPAFPPSCGVSFAWLRGFNLKWHQTIFWVIAASVPSTAARSTLLAPQADSPPVLHELFQVQDGHRLAAAPSSVLLPTPF